MEKNRLGPKEGKLKELEKILKEQYEIIAEFEPSEKNTNNEITK